MLGLWPAKTLAVAIAILIALRCRNCRGLFLLVSVYSLIVLWNLHFSIAVMPVLAVSIIGLGAVAGYLFLTRVNA